MKKQQLFAANAILATIDIVIDYAKGHTQELAILAFAFSLTLANSSI